MGQTQTIVYTCDCCGFQPAVQDRLMFTQDLLRDQYYCNEKGCGPKFLTGAFGTSLNALKLAHTSVIIGGVIPQHP